MSYLRRCTAKLVKVAFGRRQYVHGQPSDASLSAYRVLGPLKQVERPLSSNRQKTSLSKKRKASRDKGRNRSGPWIRRSALTDDTLPRTPTSRRNPR